MEDTVAELSPLLILPCELRLRIYDEIVPAVPLKSNSPPTEFTGLLYSCKTIQYELEPEICKRMITAVADIAATVRRSSGRNMMYTPPTCFAGWRDLTICFRTQQHTFRSHNPFLVFREFWFDTLTVHLHNTDGEFQFLRTHPYVHATRRLANEMARCATSTGSIPRPKRMVLLFSEDVENFVVHRVVDKNEICYDKKLRWVWQHTCGRRGSGVVFCKIPLSTSLCLDPTEEDRREMFRDVKGRGVTEMGCEMKKESYIREIAPMQRDLA